MSSSNSPCAACKCLRRKCTQECVFAPYFPPDNPHKFTNVHKVFGASNVSKLLNDLSPSQREDAVNSLAYEAEQRLRDPVFGCVGLISLLQSRLRQVQHDLEVAKKELAAYIGPSAMLPVFNHHAGLAQTGFGPGPYHQVVMPYSAPQQNMMGPSQHQILEAQIAAAREQEMMRSFEQQNQESELLRFNNGGFGEMGVSNNVVTVASGFSDMTMQPPSLALGVSGYEQAINYENQIQQVREHEIQLQLQQSQELLIQQQNSVVMNSNQNQQQVTMGRAKSEEGRSNIGPS